MRCGLTARATGIGERSPSCRTRLSRLAPAQRRAGEFQILAYKIRRSPQPSRGEGSFMLTDRYGLPLSTTSPAARDDYVLATDRALTFYPGAAEAYDRAIAAEPGFALAHADEAQVLMRQGGRATSRQHGQRWRRRRAYPAVCPNAKPATSGFSILYSRAEQKRQSPLCIRTSRHGPVTRWLFP